MENWVTFLLVNIVLALVISVFGNFATGWIRSAYNKSVFSSRKKRIDSLVWEYRRIKEYKENYPYLIVASIRQLTYGIMAFSVGITGVSVGASEAAGQIAERNIYIMFVYMLGAGMMLVVLMVYQTVIIPIYNTLNFDEYREKVVAKLKKLGGNPEDLDKEERPSEQEAT